MPLDVVSSAKTVALAGPICEEAEESAACGYLPEESVIFSEEGHPLTTKMEEIGVKTECT